jgi:hypothetical protein
MPISSEYGAAGVPTITAPVNQFASIRIHAVGVIHYEHLFTLGQKASWEGLTRRTAVSSGVRKGGSTSPGRQQLAMA